MAAVSVERAMNLNGKSNHLHPFFSNKKLETTLVGTTRNHEEDEQPNGPDLETDAPKKRGKRSKKQETNGQKTIFQGFGIKPEVTTAESSATVASINLQQEADLETDPNHDRRKRRKTVSPEPQPTSRARRNITRGIIQDSDEGLAGLDWHQQLQIEATRGNGCEEEGVVQEDVPSSDLVDENVEQDYPAAEQGVVLAAQETTTKNDADENKRTKTMRLKGGKLASPQAQKQEESPKAPRRGRRAKHPEQESLVVKVDYAKLSLNTQELGKHIQGILDGERIHELSNPVQPTITRPKLTGPPKSTHPFFRGKAAMKDTEPKPFKNQATTLTQAATQSVHTTMSSPRKASTTTPGKLRTQRDAFKMPACPSLIHPALAANESKKLKHVGDHPTWPTRDNTHVRGMETLISQPSVDIQAAGFLRKSAKRRILADSINDQENILQIQAKSLRPVDTTIREPQRVITTGAGLQTTLSKDLSVIVHDTRTEGSSRGPVLEQSAHPALLSMYQGIESGLSPFDRFECETQAWTSKYGPKSATHVLQAGKEALVLRDWLQRSTISAVQAGSNRSTASSTISSSRPVRIGLEKKKRKRKDEDDFIVDSDGDIDERNELLTLSDSSRKRTDQRSLVRGGDDYPQCTPGSTVLLSGAHGSGKTAAVYAVAKELGFEIFEINSASRRSGKDVLDKIGDMTENHLVQQVSKALTEDKPSITGAKLEAIQIEEPDAPNPKQKSMASFFKAAPATKKLAPTSKTLLSKSVAKAKDEGTKPKARQKQSLILLEEVDVLFEEDRQFWLTILTLATHSKRPIIMTCNDERYVPIESLTFHAILRFVPPPVDLATDYLLLLAAREGHILQRSSVKSLYKTKNYNLRGSITELNFWCQMAVSDSTHGFNWMLDRYPPGIDVDAYGRTIRVASKHSFVRGINVVSHDLQQCVKGSSDIEESLWSQAWDDWQVDVVDPLHEQEGSVNTRSSVAGGMDALEFCSFTADVLSASDVSFGFSMRESNKQHLDHAMPPLREKTIASHALGLSGFPDVLQVEPLVDYTSLDQQLAVATQLGLVHYSQNYRQSSDSYNPSTVADDIIHAVEAKTSTKAHLKLPRHDFSVAFDPLAYDPDDTSSGTGTYVAVSSFDREFSVITTDLAPYIRTIARDYQLREEERLRMSNLLSAGGKRRQTRAANAAMDGGRRSERRARYFELLRKMRFDADSVLATGGENWSSLPLGSATGTNSVAGEEATSLKSTQESDA